MPHLQLYIFAGFTVLVIASTALFVMLRPGPTASISTWEAGGALFPWSESQSLQKPETMNYQGTGARTLGVVPLPPTESMSSASFDELAALLADLVQPLTKPAGEPEDFEPSSYSFIPQGLLSVTTEKPRSPEQQALHEYGNTLGLSLNGFADLHPDMPQVLKDQAEDRANSTKAAAVKRLGADFVALGAEIAAISPVPPAAAALQGQLAAAYRNVGENLSKIPDASADEAFLAAINTYNSSAETLSTRLVDTVDLFQNRAVTFSPSDPGSVFTFSAGTSF